MTDLNQNGNKIEEEKPPVLTTWKQLYAIVFLNLVLLIILFYVFTRMFS